MRRQRRPLRVIKSGSPGPAPTRYTLPYKTCSRATMVKLLLFFKARVKRASCNSHTITSQQIGGDGCSLRSISLDQLRQHVRGEEVREKGVALLVGDAAIAQIGARQGRQAQIRAIGERKVPFQFLANALGKTWTRALR